MKEINTPYPTIAELSLGASPAIDAIAPAVIIGAIADYINETTETTLSQENILQIIIAKIGAIISFITNAIEKGFKSSFGNLNCNCKPTATRAIGTIVLENDAKTFERIGLNSTPIKNKAATKEIKGGKVRTLSVIILKVI